MSKLIIKNRYGVIPNHLLNDSDISFKAKGIYAYIQSKPEDWDFSAERISNQTKEGLSSVKSALIELENKGYLNREKHKNSKGFWEIEYILFENPVVDNPPLDNPPLENPTVENHTNNSKQDYSKKDISKQDISNISNDLTNRDLIFNKWFDYKKEKKQSYKPIGKESLIKSKEIWSDEQLEIAISFSISNNYSGIFLPKQSNNGNSNDRQRGTSIDRMEALKNW